MLGAGLSASGVSSAGYGEPTDIASPNNQEWNISGTNKSGNNRYINPETKDYEMNSYGLFVGQTSAEQMVYLAMATVRGSAAQYNLGQNFYKTRTIAGNYEQLLTSQINEALADLISANIIILNSIKILRLKRNALMASVSWTDPKTNSTFTTNI